MTTFWKDPDASLDYRQDWSDWLPVGSSIQTSTWTVPAGIVKESESNDSTSATIWLSGGSAGVNYRLVNRIVTDDSPALTEERSIIIRVRED